MKTVMKLAAVLAVMLLIAGGCASSPSNSKIDELDKVIRDASDYLNNNISEGNKIVILNIQSSSPDLSNYIIDELIANAVNDKIFSVVDRQQLDAIRAEQNFQWSGEVDDDSAMEIGKFFGAQTIVSGAISRLGSGYRIRIRALEVLTAQVQGQYNRNIASSPMIAALMDGGGRTAQTASPAPATTTVSRERVVPLRWTLGQMKDSFGDGTGEYYMTYDADVVAVYEDTWGSQNASLKDFSFSRKRGLFFRCKSMESFTGFRGHLIVKGENGDERRFTAQRNSSGLVWADFSEDMLKILLSGPCKARFQDSTGTTLQFEVPPRFSRAWEELLASRR